MAHRSDAELISLLAEQVRFLQSSAASFDSGFEGEAKRLATTLRVLLHDTERSNSVLGQLGIKTRLRYVDTAVPIRPGNLLDTPGLVMGEVTSGIGGSYVPPLDDLSPSRIKPLAPFDIWWNG